MTNLFPIEALDNFKGNKVVEKIRTAQKNYEIRDLILSAWAKLHPECIAYKLDGFWVHSGSLAKVYKHKRVIFCNNKPYPFKQSAPHKLVDLFIEAIESDFKYGEFNMKERVEELYYSITNRQGLFFCSKEYTKLTGIEPHICTYEESVKLYIDYLQWKINKKEV